MRARGVHSPAKLRTLRAQPRAAHGHSCLSNASRGTREESKATAGLSLAKSPVAICLPSNGGAGKSSDGSKGTPHLVWPAQQPLPSPAGTSPGQSAEEPLCRVAPRRWAHDPNGPVTGLHPLPIVVCAGMACDANGPITSSLGRGLWTRIEVSPQVLWELRLCQRTSWPVTVRGSAKGSCEGGRPPPALTKVPECVSSHI